MKKGHIYRWRHIAWADISEFLVISKTDHLGADRPVLVVKLRDGRRVVTEFQGRGMEPVFSYNPDTTEENNGLYLQPAQKFFETVDTLRAALTAHRSSPMNG